MKTTKAKTKDDFLGLDPAHFKIFSEACNRVYQTVGHELGPKAIRRNDLIEVVLDGGFFDTYGKPHSLSHKEWEVLYKTTLRSWISEHYGTPKFNKLMKLVFPFERYET